MYRHKVLIHQRAENTHAEDVIFSHIAGFDTTSKCNETQYIFCQIDITKINLDIMSICTFVM